MDAKSSAAVTLSGPAAAQRCAEGAGLDSGTAVAAQSAMPSIAVPCHRTDRRSLFTNAAAPAAPQLQSRVSTSLTDVTHRRRRAARQHSSAGTGALIEPDPKWPPAPPRAAVYS